MKAGNDYAKKIRSGGVLLKYLVVFILFFSIVVLPAILWAEKELASLGRESLQRRLLAIASAASTVIDAGKHEKIVSPEDEDSPFYWEALFPLKKISGVLPSIESIYTVRKTDKKNIVTFVLDTAEELDENGDGEIDDNETKAHVGEEYDIEEYPDFQKAFEEPSVDQEINCDKWGCWLSGYAPVRDATGRVIAVVGVDMSADEVKEREAAWGRLALLFSIFCVMCCLIIIYISYLVFVRPIKKISKGIDRFSKDLNYRLKIGSKDEFGLIAFEFNKMAAMIQASITDLEKKVKERTLDLVKANEKLEKINRELNSANNKLKELDEMRKNFVSYTAHELKNPLNVFRWSFELLRNEDLGKINLKQREIIDQLYLSNERSVLLVNDLLDVARLDEARMKIEIAPCRIEEIIDEAAGNLAVRMRTKQIKLVWEKPGEPFPEVEADKNRILQVVLNILGNAIKFSPSKKKVEIKVSLVQRIAPPEVSKKYGFTGGNGKYVLVSIIDQGFGIPKEEQEKIFSRFFRGSNVKTKIEGTGLGMFISLEIIKLHKGAIWFESKEGEGTTFNFTLPAA